MITRLFAVSMVVLMIGAIPVAALGQTGPMAELVVGQGENAQRVQIPVVQTQDKKTWGLGEYDPESGEYMWSTQTDEYSVMISGIMNPDPSIAYGIAVVDFGAPSTFGFFFFTPIVPTGAPNVVTASIVGGLTDFTGDGVSITPFAQPTLQVAEVFAPATNMGVDVGPAFAAGPAAPGSFYGYGPFAAGPIAGPGPGPWTGLATTTAFTLSGGGDVAALTGFASIELIPEPSTIALAALACLGIAGMLRRRK